MQTLMHVKNQSYRSPAAVLAQHLHER